MAAAGQLRVALRCGLDPLGQAQELFELQIVVVLVVYLLPIIEEVLFWQRQLLPQHLIGAQICDQFVTQRQPVWRHVGEIAVHTHLDRKVDVVVAAQVDRNWFRGVIEHTLTLAFSIRRGLCIKRHSQPKALTDDRREGFWEASAEETAAPSAGRAARRLKPGSQLRRSSPLFHDLAGDDASASDTAPYIDKNV